jgi:hypothetical protein
MALYSVKKSRGRKIKKYRKSRRGKGHGKTRRYKVFKNKKNHTLGKRKGKGKGKGRQMKGGLLELNFSSDNIRIMDYINVTYNDKFVENGIQETGFTSMEFKVDIRTMITNTSKIFRKDNKHQRILIYACLENGTLKCYALVRVPDKGLYATPAPPVQYDSYNTPVDLTNAQKSKIPIDGMDTKILFIFPDRSEFTSEDINSTRGLWKKWGFKSFMSSNGDTYKILVQSNDKVTELVKLLSPPIISQEDLRYYLGNGF